ncbi:helix-turn-helix domain-containing protein [Nocardia sp. NBC_00511]|uniref:helix-turn-helix domain-containing protein n=1 Tax=Nocardia sp. NBC_00511 TaxID=2903591 RepID=UPI0030E06C24
MAKMGRRKRSRLITQGVLTSGKDNKDKKVTPRAAEVVEARPAEVVEAKATPAPAAKAPAAPTAPAGDGELDVTALADRVKARRREKGWTQADVARNGGPSAGMISQIERSLMDAPAAEVLAKLDAALEWPSDTADAILRGSAPAELAGTAS